jgi:hypothetical protein
MCDVGKSEERYHERWLENDEMSILGKPSLLDISVFMIMDLYRSSVMSLQPVLNKVSYRERTVKRSTLGGCLRRYNGVT